MPALLRHVRYVMGENPLTVCAFSLFLLLLCLAVFGPVLAPYDPLGSDTEHALAPPSWAHWFSRCKH